MLFYQYLFNFKSILIKMQNQFNVVMLATEKASNILLTSKGVLTQCFTGGERENAIKNGAKPQDIHIVDTHAIINVGDWYIDSLVHPNLILKPLQMTCYCDSNCKIIQSSTGTTSPVATSSKVIASTDKSLGLPEIPQNVIDMYINYHNHSDKLRFEIVNGIKQIIGDYVFDLRSNFLLDDSLENNPKEYNQIPFTQQEQEDFKQVIECSKELQKHTCKRCGGKGHPSKVLNNTLVSFDDEDGRGQVQARIGNAKLVDCIKCEDCGHSWIPEQSQEFKLTPLQETILWNKWTSYPFYIKFELENLLNTKSVTIEDIYKIHNDETLKNKLILMLEKHRIIPVEKQQELWKKWESYSIDIQSAICSKILNHSNSDCYVDMNDLLYLDSIGIREQTAILVAKVKIVSLLTNNYFGECDYATLHEAHVTNIDYNVPTNTYTIILCRPGLLIGKGGEGYDRLCKELNAKIEIIEHKWY